MKLQRKLEGHTVLVVQSEELCAMIIADALQEAGARVVVCNSPGEALQSLGSGDISAAVLDEATCGADSQLCNQLNQRKIPYLKHDGLIEVHGTRGDQPEQRIKPVSADNIVAGIAKLLITS